MQSKNAEKLAKKYHFKITLEKPDSIILIKEGKVFNKSSAAIKIVSDFGGVWFLTKLFLLIPKIIRDFIYDFIGKNRYKWFGKKDFCKITK